MYNYRQLGFFVTGRITAQYNIEMVLRLPKVFLCGLDQYSQTFLDYKHSYTTVVYTLIRLHPSLYATFVIS